MSTKSIIALISFLTLAAFGCKNGGSTVASAPSDAGSAQNLADLVLAVEEVSEYQVKDRRFNLTDSKSIRVQVGKGWDETRTDTLLCDLIIEGLDSDGKILSTFNNEGFTLNTNSSQITSVRRVDKVVEAQATISCSVKK